MSFLTPAGLWLAALAVPILLLYMLKLRRKQVSVSSTLLWSAILRDQQANAPWQKLRRNLLLLLELLILAGLVLALARPSIPTPVVASGSVTVLMDASASMNATDVSPSRFEAARRAIRDLIDDLPGNSRMTLILAGHTPQTLITAEDDKTLLRQALGQAQVTQGDADWPAAFSLAAAAAQINPTGTTTVIVSDGGLPQTGLPALPGEVRYIPVGLSGDNIAITALAIRSSADQPELFVEVTNFGDAEQNVLISFYLGESLIDARQLDLQAHAAQNLTLVNLPPSSGVYKARLSKPQNQTAPLDSFSLDDTAYAVYQSAAARRVLLVSNGNIFLEQLLASLPGIQPFRSLQTGGQDLQLPTTSFNLYIFDGILPAQLPDADLLLVNPPGNPLFTVGPAFKDLGAVQVEDNSLTRYVDWSNVHILQMHNIQLPDWAEVLVNSTAGPLVFAGEIGGRRVAVVTFDLHQSDLPLQTAFPILFTNLINYLSPPAPFDATQSLHPGQSLTIQPDPAVDKVVIASPSNQAYTFAPITGSLTFTGTQQLGFYAANFLSKDANTVEYFAVNLFDPVESDIRPRPALQISGHAVTASVSQLIGQRELWPWLAVSALALLLIEWQAVHRRPLPRWNRRPADS